MCSKVLYRCICCSFIKSSNNTKQQECSESNSLIIRNISFDATEEEVFNLVKKYGVIRKFRLPQCKNSKLEKNQ
jgi:RNA recognition motif-containing protein